MPSISQLQGDGTGAARPFPEDGEAVRRQERKSKTFALLALADPVKAVPLILHHIASLRNGPELLGKFQQPEFRFDDLFLNACH